MTIAQFPIWLASLQAQYPALKPILALLESGGPVVWLLGLLSVFALAITLSKIWQQWRTREHADRVEEIFDHLERGDTGWTDPLTSSGRGPRGQVVSQAVAILNAKILTTDELRAEMARVSREALAPLSRGLRPLEVIATVAPLLGLLGTVLGMIEAFRAMESAGPQINPAILSGGIWQALLTTAVGLAVAIPVSLIHSWFERRYELKIANLQNDVQRTIKAFLDLPEHAAQRSKVG